MGYIIAACGLVFAIWVFRRVRERGAYYNAAEREMQRLNVDSSIVDEKFGRGKYHATLEFMRKHGLSPEDAAEAIVADLNGEYNAFWEKMKTHG